MKGIHPATCAGAPSEVCGTAAKTRRHPRPEQWEALKSALRPPFGGADLTCDGHRVDVRVRPVSEMRYALIVYIDGVWKGEWYRGEYPPARKFGRKVERYLYSAPMRRNAAAAARNRSLSPPVRKQMQDAATRAYIYWTPEWLSADALIRHLRRNCEVIEIVGGEARLS